MISSQQPAEWVQGLSLEANRLGVKTLFIERGSPWKNGYVESFNGRLRDELLNCEIFTTLAEAQILIQEWRKEYNQRRPLTVLSIMDHQLQGLLCQWG